MVNTSLLGRRASSQGRITRRVGALALALLGLTCLAVFTRHGWGRTELISSKDGGGVDNIYAETGVKPDAPQKPTVHHPHHAGITARAVTAAKSEAAQILVSMRGGAVAVALLGLTSHVHQSPLFTR